MIRPVCVVVALFLSSCAGSGGSAPPAATQAKPVPGLHAYKGDAPGTSAPMPAEGTDQQTATPIEVSVEGTRVGNSVRLDITGFGRHRPAEHAMEQYKNWTVETLAGETTLERLVNGSMKVERFTVGNPRDGIWDIQVRFSMAFAVPPEHDKVTVHVTGPESKQSKHTLDIGKGSVPTNAAKAKSSPRKSKRKPSRSKRKH